MDLLRIPFCPLTKLPARPPAMSATPMKSTTRALHAAGPSPPHVSPEKAEARCDLSSRETTRKPTARRKGGVSEVARSGVSVGRNA
jgi:hypothetical protein